MSIELRDKLDLGRARDAGMEWFRHLEAAWRPRREEWMDNYRNYSSIYHKRFYTGRAKIFVPLSFQLVEAFIPAMTRGVFATMPHFDLQPVDLDQMFLVDDIKEVTKRVRATLHFEQQKKIHLFRKTIDFFRNMCIYGRATAKMFWRNDTIRRNIKFIATAENELARMIRRNEADVITYDNADLVNLDIFSYWVDPQAPDSDIQRAATVVERHLVTSDHLRRMTETLGFDGKPIYENIPKEILAGEEVRDASRTFSEGEDERRQLNDEQGKSTGIVPKGAQSHELLEFWWDYPIHDKKHWDRNSVMVLLNRTHVIRLNRNPFHHGLKPYLSAALYPKPNEFDAQGLLDPARRLQFELNDTRNQAMDWKSRALAPTFLGDASANFKESQLRFGPGVVNKVTNINGIREVVLNNILPTAFAIEQQIERDVRGASGALQQLQGAQSGQAQTASEAISLLQQANSRLDQIIMEIEEMFTIPMVEMQFELNKQFVRTPRRVREIQEERAGVSRFGQGITVQPFELIGNFDFFALGSRKMQIEALKSRQLLDFFGIMSRMPPLPGNIGILNGLIRKIWEETFGFRGAELDAMTQEGGPAIPGQGSISPENVPGMAGGLPGMEGVAGGAGQNLRGAFETMQQGAGGPF